MINNSILESPVRRLMSIPLVLILLPSTISSQAFHDFSRTCSYSIEIETSCAHSAETSDHVSVRFGDSGGNLIIVKHLKNPKSLYAPKQGFKKPGIPYSGFGRCAIDVFEAKGPCMIGKVCFLYLKKVGTDEWRPGWAKVLGQQEHGSHTVPYTFYFRTFVPENVWYGFNYCPK